MPGVDFVISALFETSGLRWEGAWATALFAATASAIRSNVEAATDKSVKRMGEL